MVSLQNTHDPLVTIAIHGIVGRGAGNGDGANTNKVSRCAKKMVVDRLRLCTRDHAYAIIPSSSSKTGRSKLYSSQHEPNQMSGENGKELQF